MKLNIKIKKIKLKFINKITQLPIASLHILGLEI